MYTQGMKKILISLLLLIMLAPVFAAKTTDSFTGLKAVDLNGKTVTSEIFKDHDVTMINIFTTWCFYCIMEMPELRTMYQELPENANLIMICADAFEAPSDLASIVKYFKLDNTVLKMTGSQLLSYCNVTGYPTSVFVDSEGNVIETVSGARSKASYMRTMNSLLEKYK